MTVEEIVGLLPENPHITREQLTPVVEKALSDFDNYRDASDYLYEEWDRLYPRPNPGMDKKGNITPEYSEWYEFGDNRYSLNKAMTDEFIARHGVKRTYEEACEIAADKWTELIFNIHIQNNGDNSKQGGQMQMMATLLKERARVGLPLGTDEKFHKLCKEYYLNGCKYKSKSGWVSEIKLYSDYGPNAPLYDLLHNAGVPDDRIENITPWKTGVTIDKHDHSVCVAGYGNYRFY